MQIAVTLKGMPKRRVKASQSFVFSECAGWREPVAATGSTIHDFLAALFELDEELACGCFDFIGQRQNSVLEKPFWVPRCLGWYFFGYQCERVVTGQTDDLPEVFQRVAGLD